MRLGSARGLVGMLVGSLVGLCSGWLGSRMSVCAVAVWELALAGGYAVGCVRWNVRWLDGLLEVAYVPKR